jgi:hypothetical protein
MAAKVRCKTGGSQLVAVSADERDDLKAGNIICPVCSAACRPDIREVEIVAEVNVAAWSGEAWQRGAFRRGNG